MTEQHTPSLPSGGDVVEIRKRHVSRALAMQGGAVPAMTKAAHDDCATLLAALTASEAERERLAADNANLGRFVAKVMEDWPDGGSFDGSDIQDMAAASGLLVETTMQQPCGADSDACACLEYYGRDEWPLQCFRVTDTLKRAREATP